MFQLLHSSGYFFDRVETIAESNYVPSYQDVLYSRARTTGIVETTFSVGDYEFRLLDVGGQRNERRKWIHCFEMVTALIFVTAISEYDEVLYEDHTMNRIVESLNLFKEIVNASWFAKTSIILFLNKKDLFEEKIKRIDMTCCFPEYQGGLDYDKGIDFIRDYFLKQCELPDRKLYTHVTCATDSKNVDFTFKSVSDIIIKQNMRESGFKQI